jgi:DNA-binding beta-propeller fold protein YncE
MDDSPFARGSRLVSLCLPRRRLGWLAAGTLALHGVATDLQARKRKRGKRRKPCRTGAARCGKTCVDTRSSAAHCGGCGRGCAADQICLVGACSHYRFVTAWGSEGDGQDDGNEEFASVGAVTVDGDGNVYIVDTGNHRVLKFDNDGGFITKWGSPDGNEGSGDDEFAFPQGIAIAPNGNALVTDHNNFRVQTFDASGGFLDTWPAQVGGTPFGPEAIAIAADGSAFVLDRLNHRVVKFDSSGDDVAAIGSHGAGDGQFEFPEDVAIDGSGQVFVADAGNTRVQKFAPDAQDPDQYGHVGTIGSPGQGDGELAIPAGVAVDAAGNVFVADTGNHRIQRFAPTAQNPHQYDVFTTWGAKGSGDGQLDEPTDLAIDTDGAVFVADFRNFRIQKFAPVD